MVSEVENVRELLQVFVRRFGLLSASCHESCCGQDLSIAQSHILFEIRKREKPSMLQIAELLGMDVTTFSRQIKGLEAKGLVVRTVCDQDRRIKLLSLTPHGVAILKEMDEFMGERLTSVLSTMTKFERETVLHSIGLLNDSLAKVGPCCQGNKVAMCK